MRRIVLTLVLAVAAGVVTTVGGARQAAAVSPGATDLVSVGTGGAQAADGGGDHDVSADGRFVVFTSTGSLDADVPASDLRQVYVRDLAAGVTTQVSYREQATGIPGLPFVRLPWDADAVAPSISADGRFVAVETEATLGDAYEDNRKVLRLDRDPDGDGVFDGPPATLLVTDPGSDSNPESGSTPSISDDGSRIAYASGDEGGDLTIAMIDPATAAVERVRAYPSVGDLTTDRVVEPALSGDGTRVATWADLYDPDVPGPSGGWAAIAVDVAAIDVEGDVAATRIDLGEDGEPVGELVWGEGSADPRVQVSVDGAHAVFEVFTVIPCGCEFPDVERRSYLVATDPDGDGAVGPAPVATTVSLDNDGEPVTGRAPTISGDGRYVAFVTDAADVHNGVSLPPTDPCSPGCEVVARDTVLDAERAAAGLPRLPGELASPAAVPWCDSTGGVCPSRGRAGRPVLSGDGGVVAFTSTAEDLVAGDDNGAADVFARRFTPTVVADPIDVGAVEVGTSATAATTVTGSGFGPLVLTDVVVENAGPGDDFALDVTTCGLALHAGDACAVSVVFTPSATGARTGVLGLTPRGVERVDVALTGVGTARPQEPAAFAVAPDPLDFGERLTLSDSPPGVVTVTNDGERALDIAGVSLPPLPAPAAPGDYRVVADTCGGAAVAAGATCTVTVVHNPRAPGDRPAVLQFDETLPDGTVTPRLVRLTGRGTAPQVLVNPAVVPVGRLTTVLGTGYPPLATVQITMPGFPEAFTADTDAAGAFTRVVVVYPNSVPGARVVDASVVLGPVPIGDTENVLVVPGTMGPPDFLARR